MCKFALFCRDIVIIQIYALLGKNLSPQNSGRVKVLTNIRSVITVCNLQPDMRTIRVLGIPTMV